MSKLWTCHQGHLLMKLNLKANKLLNPTPESCVALRGVFLGGAG